MSSAWARLIRSVSRLSDRLHRSRDDRHELFQAFCAGYIGLISSVLLRTQVCDVEGAFVLGVADSSRRVVPKHRQTSCSLSAPASQRRRFLHFFTILIRIPGETGLLSAWF